VLCIDYKVEQLFSDGDCDRSLRSFLLNKCPQGIKTKKKDWAGLIESCETTSGTAKSGSKFCAGNGKGITFKQIKGESNFNFKLCLRNVFEDDVTFADKIKFKTKQGAVKENFFCEEDYLSGLPCLDSDEFNSGDYDNFGFNTPSTNNAIAGEEMANDEELKTHSTTDLTREWPLIVGLTALGLVVFAVVGVGFCFYRKQKSGSKFTKEAMADGLEANEAVVASTQNETELVEQPVTNNKEQV